LYVFENIFLQNLVKSSLVPLVTKTNIFPKLLCFEEIMYQNQNSKPLTCFVISVMEANTVCKQFLTLMNWNSNSNYCVFVESQPN